MYKSKSLWHVFDQLLENGWKLSLQHSSYCVALKESVLKELSSSVWKQPFLGSGETYVPEHLGQDGGHGLKGHSQKVIRLNPLHGTLFLLMGLCKGLNHSSKTD